MVDDKTIGAASSGIIPTPQERAGASTTPANADDSNKPKGVLGGESLGEQEFLQLLVHQLQNQDPLNPLNSEEFAVQLAQFSQVEQLIQINEKLGGGEEEFGGGSTISSMASFLGHEVVLGDGQVQLAGGDGPNVLLEIPAGTQSGRIDFLDENGQVVGSKTLDDVTPGKQVVALKDLNIPSGAYDLRALTVSSAGRFEELKTSVTGTVEGFVLEPEPALIVNGEQVLLSEVVEVQQGQSAR